MAIDFVAASNQKLIQSGAGALLRNRDFSLSMWIQRDVSGVVQGLWSWGGGNWYFRLSTTNKLNFLESNVADIATANTALDTNWNHVGVSLDASGNGEFWLNGVSDGTFSTSNTLNDGTASVLTIACDNQANGTSFLEFFDGRIAEIVLYDLVLDANEWKALANTYPWNIRRLDQLGIWPLWGLHSPEIEIVNGLLPLTLSNGPTAAEHAPIIPFLSEMWQPSAAETAAPDTQYCHPWFCHA